MASRSAGGRVRDVDDHGFPRSVGGNGDRVGIDGDLDEARMHARHLAVPDYHDIINAVSPSPKKRPGHASLDVRWRGHERDRTRIRDATFGFVGEFVPTHAHITFRVSDDGAGVHTTSHPHGQETVSGGIGHECNGIDFS